MGHLHIADDYLPSGYRVSTIRRDAFLLDFDPALAALSQAPGIERGASLNQEGEYESVVFRCLGERTVDWSRLAMRRYATEEEAREGHAELVAIWSARN